MARRVPPAPRIASARALLGSILLVCGGASGCGSGDVEGGSAPGPGFAAVDPSRGSAGRDGGASDPRRDEVVRLLEAGLLEPAAALLAQVAPPGQPADLATTLLRARLELLGGDALGALRRVEEARALDAGHVAVAAAEIEVLVLLDKLEGARELLREALKAHGPLAPLERARGLCFLRTPGGGPQALAALESALELDPELAFTRFPLHQARLLTGRAHLASGAPDQALAQALLARRLFPENPESLELEAEARGELLDFEGALALFERMEEVGLDTSARRAGLHRRRATALLLENRREEALRDYARARRLGLDDQALGFGAHLLAEELEKRLERGSRHLAQGRTSEAEGEFRGALEIDPENAAARHHLGVCRFRAGDHRGAAEAWEAVLEEAWREDLELPDPVHLNLAKAWRQAGEVDRARTVLSRYLDRRPEGEWGEATRELLTRLEAEALAAEPRGRPESAQD